MLKIMASDTERLLVREDGSDEEEDVISSEADVLSAEEGGARKRRHKRLSLQNINVRAAFIHTIGDLVQSIGVIVAGYIIWFKVSDIYSTFFFC